MAYNSVFGYNISRQYPYRWFTPVVIIGGIIGFVVFTLLNFSSNSVILTTILTTDRNATEAEYGWFKRPPWSWRQELKTECQDSNVALGTKLFTSNYGLSYTLDDVSDEQGQALPSLSYAQNVLENCSVQLVDVQFKRADTATPAIHWWTWRFTDATVNAQCNVNTQKGPRTVDFSTVLGTHAEDIRFLIDRHDNVTAAKWWGAALTQAYYMLMTIQMSKLRPENDDTVSIDYMRCQLRPGNGSFEDRDFFQLRYQWQLSDGNQLDTNNIRNGTELPAMSVFYNQFNETFCNSDGTECYLVPDITNELEGFASALYSLVMVDLGQIKQPNILTDPNLLQRYLSGEGNNRENPTGNRPTYSPPSSVTTEEALLPNAWATYTDLHNLTSEAATNAIVFSQYTCSVPQVRDGLTIFLSVLVADMVFMSALWALLNWIATLHLTRTDYKAMHCDGHCGDEENHPLTNLNSNLSSDTAFSAVPQEGEFDRNTRVSAVSVQPKLSVRGH